MKTEFEKMRSSEEYHWEDPAVEASLMHGYMAYDRFNHTHPGHPDYRSAIEDLIPGIPESSLIAPPFYCDHGNGITIGTNVIINFNCAMMDCAEIKIGDNVKIGPNCSFYTSRHPLDYLERRQPKETAHPITVGNDCWLGGNVTVVGPVNIGARCVIGAGSVVVKDIPDDSLAVGNPCRVIRKLN